MWYRAPNIDHSVPTLSLLWFSRNRMSDYSLIADNAFTRVIMSFFPCRWFLPFQNFSRTYHVSYSCTTAPRIAIRPRTSFCPCHAFHPFWSPLCIRPCCERRTLTPVHQSRHWWTDHCSSCRLTSEVCLALQIILYIEDFAKCEYEFFIAINTWAQIYLYMQSRSPMNLWYLFSIHSILQSLAA